MGVPTSEVGYTPAMSRREDHEVHKGHVVALEGEKNIAVKKKPETLRHKPKFKILMRMALWNIRYFLSVNLYF